MRQCYYVASHMELRTEPSGSRELVCERLALVACTTTRAILDEKPCFGNGCKLQDCMCGLLYALAVEVLVSAVIAPRVSREKHPTSLRHVYGA